MNVPGQCRSFGTVPSLRQIVLGISLFSLQRSMNEFPQSPLVSVTSMAKSRGSSAGMRVALKHFHEWREGNRWIAEEGIDGYGACGSTTTIDRGGGSKLVKNPQHRSLSALQRTYGCRVVPGSVGLHRSALRAMRRADRSGHSSQSSTTPYKCTRPRQEVVESVRVKRKKLPHVSMADSVRRVVSSYAIRTPWLKDEDHGFLEGHINETRTGREGRDRRPAEG